MAYLHIIPLIGSSFITNFMHFCEKNEITCINVSSISIKKNGSIMQVVIPQHSFVTISSAEAFVFF